MLMFQQIYNGMCPRPHVLCVDFTYTHSKSKYYCVPTTLVEFYFVNKIVFFNDLPHVCSSYHSP